MKHKSHQVEITWEEPEPFELAVQTAQDGDRIVADAKEKEENKHQSDQQQEKFDVL